MGEPASQLHQVPGKCCTTEPHARNPSRSARPLSLSFQPRKVDSVRSLTLPHPRLSLQDHMTCPHFVTGVGLPPDPEGILCAMSIPIPPWACA